MKVLCWFLLITLCVVHTVHAQPNKAAIRKLSPVLQQRLRTIPSSQSQVFWIVTSNTDSLKSMLSQQKIPVQVMSEHAGGLLVVKTTWRTLDSLQTRSTLIQFVDIPRRPMEELALPSYEYSLNALNQVHHDFPAWNGNNLVVSVKENKPDSTDIDFTGRWLPTTLGSPSISSHATIMATIVAGAGNSFYTGKGAAPGATISTSDFASLLPDAANAYTQYGISVQNHSYGTGIENYYGADAAAYDATTNTNQQLLHVFSAGNSGNGTPASGAYAGIANTANITGSFKMAKNIITVAATDSFGKVSWLSSKGPAYDGRIKPELVAFGQDGSSGAAALTSGVALLLQQAYKEQHSGALPPATLVKAILLNSADDIGTKGPDFESGYGNLNAYKAMQTITAGHFSQGSVAQGGVVTFSLPVGVNTRQLKITLCWNDPAAAANAPKALVNDLDMQLVNINTWLPWILNTKPVKDSLLLPAVRGRDSLNNVEQITIDDPAAGAYTIRIQGSSVATGNQAFYIAWQQDTANRFQWQYPLSTDLLTGGRPNIIRWHTTFNTTNGQLQYSFDKGTTWRLLNNATPLANRYYYWPVPDTFSTALLRMTINGQTFTSDTFTVSAPLPLHVGFNCTDSLMLYWNKMPGVQAYTVYRLGAKYLQPITTITDTSIIVRQPGETHWYTVEPVIANNHKGIRSHTIDYTMQGVGCYLKNFLADLLTDNTARLLIEIGTTFNIKSITAEKWSRNQFQPLQTIQPVTSLQYAITDNALHHGANTYRIKIELQNGAVIYSDPQTIYYFLHSKYLVFPNPAKTGGSLQVVTEDPDQVRLVLFNTLGQKLLEQNLNETTEHISLQGLQRGLYFIMILKKGKKDFTGSLIVQ
jgi:hypothetical protein